MGELERIKQAMTDGEHTDGDLEWCIEQIEYLESIAHADGVHSCGPDCTRIWCVQRRRIKELEELVRKLREDRDYKANEVARLVELIKEMRG